MKKHISLLALLFLFVCTTTGQEKFRERLNKLYITQDTIAQEKILKEWEQSNPDDAELYVAYFNHFVNKSRNEILRLTEETPSGDQEALALSKAGESESEPSAYIYSEIDYEPRILKKGLDYIDIGIKKYPDRLDMRFGKSYIYSKSGDYDAMTNEIIAVLERSAKNGNKWTWTDNKLLEDGKSRMFDAVQDYVYQLYGTGDDRLLDNMKSISEKVLEYYPDHVYSLSNLSIVYMISEKYDKALEVLLKAYRINSEDQVIINNLAHAYKMKGDKPNAIKYYTLLLEHADEQMKDGINKQIESLSGQ